MPIFFKLFELIPNAEYLLSLEPEELAGPLLISLVSLDNHQSMRPEGIISFGAMSSVMNHRAHQMKADLLQRYPPKSHDEVLFALMEAWQWLQREGFVAPSPTDLSSITSAGTITTYFVTRRGLRVETPEDLQTYHKANLLPKGQLHPIIAQKVWSPFLQADYDAAVLLAFKQVEVAVRKAGGYAETDYGTDLMRKAFHVNNGNLTDQKQQIAEKQARSDLFAGAIGSYKNPGSHREVEITAEEAAEVIIFASHLLRIVDSCNQPEAN